MEEEKGSIGGRLFLFFNCIMMFIGGCGGPLILRLYFIHGGNRIWFSSWITTAGFPVAFLPLAAAYYIRRRCRPTSSIGAGSEHVQQGSVQTTTTTTTFVTITRNTFLAAAAIGILTGIINYLYTYGVAKLPVSTSSLVIASQLVFTAGGAWLLVKHRFTVFTVNAVVLLVIGAGVLAAGASGDRPAGESKKEYVAAFVMTLLAAVLYGVSLPCIELSYIKARQCLTYTLVLEFQMVLSLFATAFCTLGMLINKDFQAISREARGFDLGEANYYVIIVFTALIWQLYFIGAAGTICYGSSLLSGVILAATLSVTEVFAVVFYGEKFGAEKGISLALSLWGFVSFFYGEVMKNGNSKEEELQIQVTNIEANPTLHM